MGRRDRISSCVYAAIEVFSSIFRVYPSSQMFLYARTETMVDYFNKYISKRQHRFIKKKVKTSKYLPILSF